MTDFIRDEGLLLAGQQVEHIRRRVPLELVANQEVHAEGEPAPASGLSSSAA